MPPFETACHLEVSGDPAALDTYRAIVAGNADVQEVYVSLWRIAVLTASIEAYLMAHVYRPCRLEALVDLCVLLRQQEDWATIYTVSRGKRGIVTRDTLMVDPAAEWRIVEEHGIAALRLGCVVEAIPDFEFVLSYDLPAEDERRVQGWLMEASKP